MPPLRSRAFPQHKEVALPPVTGCMNSSVASLLEHMDGLTGSTTEKASTPTFSEPVVGSTPFISEPAVASEPTMKSDTEVDDNTLLSVLRGLKTLLAPARIVWLNSSVRRKKRSRHLRNNRAYPWRESHKIFELAEARTRRSDQRHLICHPPLLDAGIETAPELIKSLEARLKGIEGEECLVWQKSILICCSRCCENAPSSAWWDRQGLGKAA